MNNIILTFICTLLNISAMTQVTFTKNFGTADFYERGNSVMQTSDEGYIATGRNVRFGSGGGVNAYLIKIDKEGNQEWEKSFGGKGSEEGLCVRVTQDRGYIITGYTNSFGAGASDVYLIKTDENGNEEWSKTYGGNGIDKGHSVKQTKDGGYIITGETYSFGEGWVNCYLIKTDEHGDTLWTKVYGGNGIEEGNSVFQSEDGGYVITGATNSFGAGDYDVYLIRTDAQGNLLWMQTFGGSGPERGLCVEETSDKGFVISGYTESFGKGGVDVYVIKTNAKGEKSWTQVYGGKTDEVGNYIIQTRDNDYVVCGRTNSFGNGGNDAYLIKIDEKGETKWTRTFGTSDDETVNCVQEAKDGGYILTGNAIKFSENGQNAEKINDLFMVKTASNGLVGK